MQNEQDINIAGDSAIKKPNLAIRILHVVWATLLAILLAAGIFVQAPWKVIVLIAIFLAAATILPRRRRKWFWAGVGVVVLAVIVWIFLPSDNEGWRPYTFDKELAELQARYAVPDSENAAIIYNQILETWKQKEPNEPNLPDRWFNLVSRGPWLGKDQPEIAAYIQYHQDTIEQLLQASRLKQCSFPIIADSFVLGEQMERISTMRPWAYLLIAAGNNNMAEGGTNEAVEKYLAVLRMSRHLSRQTSAIEMLVGIAIEALGFGGANNFVVWADANEPCLGKLEQAVSEIKHDFNSDLQGFIDSDKLMFKNMLGGLFYEVNSKGKVRFSHDPLARIREQTKEQFTDVTTDDGAIFSGYWFKILFKSYTILYWFYVPATPEELGRIIDESYEKHYLMTKPDFDWSKEKQNELTDYIFRLKLNLGYLAKEMARINSGVYIRFHDIYLRALSNQRATLLIIALRRYKNTNGRWPEKLDDVALLAPAEIFVDPVNGDSFVYKRTDENFTLYSKGKNNIDEGGEHKNNWPKEDSPDDQLIWPRPAKKTAKQEETTNAAGQ
jgi:hypothetical protein